MIYPLGVWSPLLWWQRGIVHYAYVCVCVCVLYIYICVCVCVCVCSIYIYMFTTKSFVYPDVKGWPWFIRLAYGHRCSDGYEELSTTRSPASQMIESATISLEVKATGGVAGLKQCLHRDSRGRVQLERERHNWEPRHRVPPVTKCCLQEVAGCLLRTLRGETAVTGNFAFWICPTTFYVPHIKSRPSV